MTSHVTIVLLLLLLLLSSSSYAFPTPCPEGCSCSADPVAYRDVTKPVRITCSPGEELPASALESFPRRGEGGKEEEEEEEAAYGDVTHLELSGFRTPVVLRSFKIFSAFPLLRHLNLSRNGIESVEDGAFGRLRFLRTLVLSRNRLTLLGRALFHDELVSAREDHGDVMNDMEENDDDDDDDGDEYKEEEEEEEEEVKEEAEEEEEKDDDEDSASRPIPSLKKSLVELDLSYNELTGIDGALEGLESLVKITLNDNRLTNVTEVTFRGLTGLRWLILSSNRLLGIDEQAFATNGKLTNLMLRDNPDLGRTDVRLNLRHCPYLSYLDASECGLERVPRGLPDSLRYLQLRRNRLPGIDVDSFAECRALNILLLDGNRIASIERDSLIGLSSLQQLWLNENQLTEAPRRLPKSLQRLLLDGNGLTDWSPTVFDEDDEGRPSSLSILSLSGNKLTRVSAETFKELTALTSLDLSDNAIESLPAASFSENAALESLNLNKNPLLRLDDDCLAGLAGLRNLHLSFVDTRLDDLKASRSLLKPVGRSLKVLEVDHSPSLARIFILGRSARDRDDGFAVSSLVDLEELSLTGLDLTTLKKADLYDFLAPRLKSLRFASARWHCDRALVWLREWLSAGSSGLESPGSNVCYTPRSLNGKPLMSLVAKDFVAVTSTTTTTTTTASPAHKPMESTPPSTTTRPTLAVSLKGSQKTRNSSKSSRKPLHRANVADSKPEGQRRTTSAFASSVAEESTARDLPTHSMNNEESLIIHVTEFIRRNGIDLDELESTNERVDGVESDAKEKNENENETELVPEVQEEEEEKKQTETGVSRLNDETDSFEKYFKKYFPDDNNQNNNNNNNNDIANNSDDDDGGEKYNRYYHVNNGDNNNRKHASSNHSRPVHGGDRSDGDRSAVIVTIAVVIIAVTAVVAAFIIFLIVLTCRKKKRKNPVKDDGATTVVGRSASSATANVGSCTASRDSLSDSNKTVVKYKSRDGLLYFSTSSMTGVDSESTADLNNYRGSLADKRIGETFRASPSVSDRKNFSANANAASATSGCGGGGGGGYNSYHHNHQSNNNNNNNNGGGSLTSSGLKSGHGCCNSYALHGSNGTYGKKTLSYRWEDT